jgi:hypothetical protein
MSALDIESNLGDECENVPISPQEGGLVIAAGREDPVRDPLVGTTLYGRPPLSADALLLSNEFPLNCEFFNSKRI